MSQFADPAQPSSGINYTELHGALLLIKPLMVEPHIQTVHTRPGEQNPAVRADVAVLDGPQAGTEYIDTLIFPRVLQSPLKSRVGQIVLGRLGQGVAKPGQSAPWTLDAASEADKATAGAFLARKSTPQVANPGPAQQSGQHQQQQSAPSYSAQPTLGSEPPF